MEGFKNFALNFKFFRNAASRFVAGETVEDAVRVVRQLNQQKILCTLDLLGENTLTREDATKAVEEVIEVLDRIQSENLDCTVSVKLTQLGLDLDKDFALRNLMQIAEHAREKGNFVRVDMENSRYTQSTLNIVARTYEQFGNVGAVIQSALRRSEQDTMRMLQKGIRIRLVKGAYLEPASIAFRKKRNTDANFVKLMKLLLADESYHAIATHDESIILATEEYARTRNILKDRFEFQMLYGIRRDLQFRLAKDCYRVRVYIPFGRHWYAYFMRRLAERPANVAFLVRNLFKE